MKMLFERTGRLLQELQQRCYPKSIPVTGWQKKQVSTRLTLQQAMEPDGWENMPQPYLWGGHRARFWFRAQVTLPEEFCRPVRRLPAGHRERRGMGCLQPPVCRVCQRGTASGL